MLLKLLIIYSGLSFAHASDNFFCSSFKECSSSGDISSSKSLPTNTAATNFNSSNVAHVKGLGIELLYLPGNPIGYSLVTGNGDIGAALISANSENTFFGNRSIELDDVYAQRRIDKKRFRTKKISLAVASSLVESELLTIDMGVSVRRNSDTKKINPGLGLSARLGFLNIGAATYKDDTKLQFGNYLNPATGVAYSTERSSSTYEESYIVKTFSSGLNFGSFTFDVGLIKTKYDFYPNETSIWIYSSSYSLADFLFSIAYRSETSDNLKEDDGKLYKDRLKKDYFFGIQYMWNSYITTGIAYNNYLVQDFSMTLSIFF